MATSPTLEAAGAAAAAPTHTSLTQFPETQSMGFTHAPPFGTRVLVAVTVAVAVGVFAPGKHSCGSPAPDAVAARSANGPGSETVAENGDAVGGQPQSDSVVPTARAASSVG